MAPETGSHAPPVSLKVPTSGTVPCAEAVGAPRMDRVTTTVADERD